MCQHIEISEKERKLLKDLWDINNKVAKGQQITANQKKFFNDYLPFIRRYYKRNYYYWDLVYPIK